MNTNNHSRTQRLQEEKEKQWEEEYRHFEAARELRRARVRAAARPIARLFRRNRTDEKAAGALPCRTGEPFLVTIDRVVGFIDEESGRQLLSLLSGRGLAREWHRVFNRDDGAYTPFKVIETKDGLYLVGTKASIVQLEILRAKGNRSVRVTDACWDNPLLCDDPEAVIGSGNASETPALG